MIRVRLLFWSLLLHVVISMCPYGSRARELPEAQREEFNYHNSGETLGLMTHQESHTHHIHAHFSTPMDHQMKDASLMVFLTIEDLMAGKRMPIHFPKRDPASSPHFLPREEADSIPFSSKELPYLLKLYSFSKHSPQAQAMEDTLRECESKTIKGEIKLCATSLESMLDFTRSILNSPFRVVSTTHLTKSTINFQNYAIVETPVEILAPKMVACHTMPYPYAIFYCHSQQSQNKVFQVSLVGDNGDKVKAAVVCHLDTSQWSPNHVSFQVLENIKPGSSSVCHFFPQDHFIWIPEPAASVTSM